MNSMLIKVGFCVAYDWELLQYAIPKIYDEANLICLSLDVARKSWAGNNFSWDEGKFNKFIKQIDPDSKIHLYEDDFHLAELSPMQNEVRQRNKMAERMGMGGWHIQLDADEYFIDFAGFVKQLKTIHTKRPLNVCCPLITLFKRVDDGYLWIKNHGLENQDMIAIATNNPVYQFGRRNGNFNVIANFPVVHQSWARSNAEILEKINNWGHKTDFSVNDYFTFWEKLTGSNYKQIINFHPIEPQQWQKLEFEAANSIPALIDIFAEKKPIIYPKFDLFLLNNIWISRWKKLINIIKK